MTNIQKYEADVVAVELNDEAVDQVSGGVAPIAVAALVVSSIGVATAITAFGYNVGRDVANRMNQS